MEPLAEFTITTTTTTTNNNNNNNNNNPVWPSFLNIPYIQDETKIMLAGLDVHV
jgi:hypothetical protein